MALWEDSPAISMAKPDGMSADTWLVQPLTHGLALTDMVKLIFI